MAAPRKARLSDSVPHDVNMISCGSHPRMDATRSRGRLLELWQLAGPAYNMLGAVPALEQA